MNFAQQNHMVEEIEEAAPMQRDYHVQRLKKAAKACTQSELIELGWSLSGTVRQREYTAPPPSMSTVTVEYDVFELPGVTKVWINRRLA